MYKSGAKDPLPLPLINHSTAGKDTPRIARKIPGSTECVICIVSSALTPGLWQISERAVLSDEVLLTGHIPVDRVLVGGLTSECGEVGGKGYILGPRLLGIIVHQSQCIYRIPARANRFQWIFGNEIFGSCSKWTHSWGETAPRIKMYSAFWSAGAGLTCDLRHMQRVFGTESVAAGSRGYNFFF